MFCGARYDNVASILRTWQCTLPQRHAGDFCGGWAIGLCVRQGRQLVHACGCMHAHHVGDGDRVMHPKSHVTHLEPQQRSAQRPPRLDRSPSSGPSCSTAQAPQLHKAAEVTVCGAKLPHVKQEVDTCATNDFGVLCAALVLVFALQRLFKSSLVLVIVHIAKGSILYMPSLSYFPYPPRKHLSMLRSIVAEPGIPKHYCRSLRHWGLQLV